MAQLLAWVYHEYRDLMDNKSDPRVKDWLMMSGPFPTFFICITFVYTVKYLGPSLMENRKPFQLQKILVVYNFLQVIFSTWLFYEAVMGGWFTSYSFRCQPVDYSSRPQAVRMAGSCWWYYMSKFTEFLDTIFFVLRKKFDHISTLHVTHHAIMPMSVWFGVKFTPGGHSTFFGMLNTFVHIVMYTYYMFAAMGPQYQKYLWWKKYLTALQMCEAVLGYGRVTPCKDGVQFVLVMVHAFQLLFTDCNYPKAFVWWIGLHAVMFYFLFADFYKQSYIKKDKEGANKKSDDKAAVSANGIEKKMVNGNGIANGLTVSNGSAKAAKVVFTSPAPSKPSVFTQWTNICQMDHALLYEDDPVSSEGEAETNNAPRRRQVAT